MRFIFIILFSLFTTLGITASYWRISSNMGSATATNISVDSARTDSELNTKVSNVQAQPRMPYDSTSKADSLHTDSVHADTVKAKPGIDSPVEYQAADSMVYDASSGLAYLYGKAQVNYQNMQLSAAKISMNMDSSMVHAEARPDSTAEGGLAEKPLYKQGGDEYNSEKMAFNFKTKKGFIHNVDTKQGDGFMKSERSKRAADGTLYLEHARYTTCDAKHPHFYLALSRAKVRPGKEVVFGPAYLVVADVPLPFAIPYGFFPFTKSYSSGFIMPTYGDESNRGFYLRDGGYYFAISDKMDLKLLGEIYTKGSWGLSAAILINGKNARLYASQGQQRSAVLSLKLAEAAVLSERMGEKPIILLDDVMSELDSKRQDFLLNKLDDCQVFITCCEQSNKEQLKHGKIFNVCNGVIS